MSSDTTNIPLPPPATQADGVKEDAEKLKKRSAAVSVALTFGAIGFCAVTALLVAINMCNLHYILRHIPESVLPQQQEFIDAHIASTLLSSLLGYATITIIPLLVVAHYLHGMFMRGISSKEAAKAFKAEAPALFKKWKIPIHLLFQAARLFGPMWGASIAQTNFDLPPEVHFLSARNLLVTAFVISALEWTITGIKMLVKWVRGDKTEKKDGAIHLPEEDAEGGVKVDEKNEVV